ncbi:MAG: hypothetical protein KKB50_16600 [Planctomycetes bacterium]|nr:hypothetical protein [Planctomycetota bacterium]
MTATSVTTTGSAAASWLKRVRFVLAVAVIWAGLHYIVDGAALGRGLHRPVVLLVSHAGLAGGLAAGLVLWVGAGLGVFLSGRRESGEALVMVGIALALWAAPGGTMDDWLLLRNETLDASASPAYRTLLADYVFLLACLAGVAVVGGLAERATRPPADQGPAHRDRLLNLESLSAESSSGPMALVTCAAVAAVLLLFLPGPRSGWTQRGQVYFAVAVAYAVGAVVARRATHARHPLWYLATPFIVGIVGLLVAALRPTLPAEYAHLNVIPAIGLVRPLPVEMVGVGVVVIVWTLRATAALHLDEERD